MALLLAALASAAMFVCAPLIPRIMGAGFQESVTALRWLCLIPVFRSVHQMCGSALTAAGLQKYRTAAQVSVAALNFVLNVWMIPAFGWKGAAWASLITDGGLGLLNWSTLRYLTSSMRGELCHADS
jgi:O-antigen/teichoic acid export membrane protein